MWVGLKKIELQNIFIVLTIMFEKCYMASEFKFSWLDNLYVLKVFTLDENILYTFSGK